MCLCAILPIQGSIQQETITEERRVHEVQTPGAIGRVILGLGVHGCSVSNILAVTQRPNRSTLSACHRYNHSFVRMECLALCTIADLAITDRVNALISFTVAHLVLHSLDRTD